MITLYEALILSDLAYKPEDSLIIATANELGYTLVFNAADEPFDTGLADNAKRGYQGLCFCRKGDNGLVAYVISHRGTDPSNVYNLIADSAIASNALPTETKIAMQFTKHCLKHIKNIESRAPRILHVGHSLGAFHAHICGYMQGAHVVGFDAPGPWEQIKALSGHEKPSKYQNYKHISIQSRPNAVNRHGSPVGRCFQLPEEINSSSISSSESIGLKYHLLKYIKQFIPQEHAMCVFDKAFRPPEDFLFVEYETPPKAVESELMQLTLGQSHIAIKRNGEAEQYSDQKYLVHLTQWGTKIISTTITVEGASASGDPFVHYFQHMRPSAAMPEPVLICERYDYHRFEKKYEMNKIVSFKLEGSDAIACCQAMMQDIEKDADGTPPDYDVWQGKTFVNTPKHFKQFWTTWALEKLAIAGITLENSEPLYAIYHKKTSESEASLAGGGGQKYADSGVDEKDMTLSQGRKKPCIIL